MPKNRSNIVGRRAWNQVRLMLLWARKGGVFRRQLMVDLRLVPKFLKNIRHISHPPRRDHIGYSGERELSFDKTPVIHVKMHRPHSMRFLVPCINPRTDFDYDFDDEGIGRSYGFEPCDSVRKSFIEAAGFEFEHHQENVEAVEAEGIDLRAEEFIAKFYEQMKLQRQISYLQYNQ